MKQKAIFIYLSVAILLAVGFLSTNNQIKQFLVKVPTQKGIEAGKSESKNIEIIAENLKIPWEIVFLPDKNLLVTERPGTLSKIGPDKTLVRITIDGVVSKGEGGLLGMAIHPYFERNNWLYLYFTTIANTRLTNQVIRYKFSSNKLEDPQTIISGIPAATFHDGGRIAFGPDGLLYITTGDAENRNSAQDINSLAGKILRLKDDGGIPQDNPFDNAVFSYGHRNPQGLTWDNRGQLWSTEHGRSGNLSGLDELNLIKKGGNYGWPEIQGDERRQGMEAPIINSGPDQTWAPSGAIYISGRILFAGLRGESIYVAKLSQDNKVSELRSYFSREFGRLRTLAIGPDGYLYVLTSNTDGRGNPKSGDDKIIRIKTDFLL